MGKRYKIIMLEIKAVLGLSTSYCIVIWLIAVFMNAKMINNISSKKDYLKEIFINEKIKDEDDKIKYKRII